MVDPGLDVVEWARREHEITRHTRAARPVHRHQSRLDVAVARRRPAATHVDFLMASTKRTIVHERRGAPDWTGLGRRAVIRRVDRTSRSSCDRWSTAHRCAAPRLTKIALAKSRQVPVARRQRQGRTPRATKLANVVCIGSDNRNFRFQFYAFSVSTFQLSILGFPRN